MQTSKHAISTRQDHHAEWERSTAGSERRRFERWEPAGVTIAAVSDWNRVWCGQVLNLSEGGVEVLGSPADARIGSLLSVELHMEGCLVRRSGILRRVQSSRLRDSHVIVFEDSASAAEPELCACCGDVAAPARGPGEIFVCADCEDRAHERIGIDFDYEELGWGD